MAEREGVDAAALRDLMAEGKAIILSNEQAPELHPEGRGRGSLGKGERQHRHVARKGKR